MIETRTLTIRSMFRQPKLVKMKWNRFEVKWWYLPSEQSGLTDLGLGAVQFEPTKIMSFQKIKLDLLFPVWLNGGWAGGLAYCRLLETSQLVYFRVRFQNLQNMFLFEGNCKQIDWGRYSINCIILRTIHVFMLRTSFLFSIWTSVLWYNIIIPCKTWSDFPCARAPPFFPRNRCFSPHTDYIDPWVNERKWQNLPSETCLAVG